MIQPPAQVAIATSSGTVWLSLIIHFGAGLLALGSGFVAITAAKGGKAHRRAGMMFVVSMIALGVVGAGIALFERNYGSVFAGLFTAYLVFTAYTTLRPLTGRRARAVNITMMAVVFGVAAFQFWAGITALGTPTRSRAGVPAAMILFIGTVTFLAAAGDWRLLRAGTIEGPRRIARHLWRMCFGLFIATGSFFLGQMNFLPESLRIIPMLVVLAVAPLFVLIYWMWRVRLRKRLQGMTLRTESGII